MLHDSHFLTGNFHPKKLVGEFLFLIKMRQDRDSFLQQQIVWISDHDAFLRAQMRMERTDVLDLSFDREILVVDQDDIADLKGKGKQQDNP